MRCKDSSFLFVFTCHCFFGIHMSQQFGIRAPRLLSFLYGRRKGCLNISKSLRVTGRGLQLVNPKALGIGPVPWTKKERERGNSREPTKNNLAPVVWERPEAPLGNARVTVFINHKFLLPCHSLYGLFCISWLYAFLCGLFLSLHSFML